MIIINNRFLLLLAGISSSSIIVITAQPPSAYDLHDLHPECQAFQRIFDQGTCSSCCAAAVATQMSLRQCISQQNTGRLYSAQQIWDCSASAAAGRCRDGVLLDRMLAAIGTGSHSFRALMDVQQCAIPLSLSPYGGLLLPLTDPDPSQCMPPNNSSAPPALGGVMTHHVDAYYASLGYASLVASRALMNEIYDNGPAVAVITFTSASDFANFASVSYLRNGKVFMPNVSDGRSYAPISHCVVVVGWGTDAASGQKYWLVQNSYGPQWADGGFARILRGADLVEAEWRGLFMAGPPLPSSSQKTTSVQQKMPPPQARRSVTAEDGLPNNDIIVLTFLCAIALACVLVCIFSPSFLRGYFFLPDTL